MNICLKMAFVVCLGMAAQSALAGNEALIKKGAEVYQAKNCMACHGAAGAKPTSVENPILAGQYADYIEQALKNYKKGVRKNAVMKGQAGTLKTQEIKALAAYLEAQPSGLTNQTQ